jgi:hypothetical protein
MGMVSYYGAVPLKANSTLHAIIVDAERDNIAFYNSTTAESEPCDPTVLSKQIDNLFRDVFWQ